MWKTNIVRGGTVCIEPTTSCIRSKRLTARPQGPHGKELLWAVHYRTNNTEANRISTRQNFSYLLLEGFWRVNLWIKILSNYYNISLGIVSSLPWGRCGLAGRRLLQMQKVVVLNPFESKIFFSIEWNVNNCFLN